MTWLVLTSVAVGICVGWLTHSGFQIPGFVENICFAVLLFAVGYSLGQDKTLWARIRAEGMWMLVIPASVVLGTLAGGLAAAFILHLEVRTTLAASAGMGWYSLAAILLNQGVGPQAGTLAFLANVFRELLSFLTIPWFVRFARGTGAIAIGGSTTMDTTLPILARYLSPNMAIAAFINGVIISLLVPVLIPIILGK